VKKDKIFKTIFGVLSAILLVSLVVKLIKVPGGMILSGLFLGGLELAGIVFVCLILSAILQIVLKNTSFMTIMLITLTLSFVGMHYQLFSPTLVITVPNGYVGEIDLILSGADENVLTVDSNGIGYLNNWTFHKTYLKPVVVQLDGTNVEKRLVGFNQSTFFGNVKSCCVNGKEIESLSFEIVSNDKIGQKQYKLKDLTVLVNKELLKY